MSNSNYGGARTATLTRLRTSWGSLVVFMFCMMVPIGSGADSKKESTASGKNTLKGKEADEVVRLRREVDALESLYHLEPTEAQLAGLLKIAEHTATKAEPAAEAIAGADYRKALHDFRDALAREDEDKVDELSEKLADLHEMEPTEVNDEFAITEAARKAAPAALKLLTAAQIVSFLAAQETEVPDPVERILLTVGEGEELPADLWKELRDATAEEVAWLVHGFDNEQAKSAVKPITALLDRGHGFKGEALKKELPALEQTAKSLVSGRSPTLILEHYMQRELAELLSNPQTVAAIKARMHAEKK